MHRAGSKTMIVAANATTPAAISGSTLKPLTG